MQIYISSYNYYFINITFIQLFMCSNIVNKNLFKKTKSFRVQ